MKSKSTHRLFIEEAELVHEQVGAGVTRTIIAFDEKIMLVKVSFEKGAIGEIHHHHHTQISYIEKGIFEVSINNEKKVLGTGSAFIVPTNAPHGVVCLEAGILLDSFSPMREDFLQ
ncbi:MAG TPA: cupin domain-containing protein [Agriterribacter sp.]|nr:cupin domain-containing protein [Agriterribacter sp.]